MDIGDYGLLSIFIIAIAVLIFELVIVIIVASAFATFLGVSGILWWAVAILTFLIINGVLGALRRV